MEVFERYYEKLNYAVYDVLMHTEIEGIPKILDLIPSGNGWLVKQELIEGETLTERLNLGLYDPWDAAVFCRELCGILEKLHAVGIVHGDLKPDNILIGADGKTYIVDFNASHVIRRIGGRDTVLLGTPGFASPEQYGFSRSDERSDVYAIGQILNIMTTGCYLQTMVESGPLRKVILKCTRMEPKRRYQSMKLLAADLKNYTRKRHMKHDWLPPGFRTLTIWKMAIAVAGYAFLVWFTSGLSIVGEYTMFEVYASKVFYLLLLLNSVFILMNYMDINEVFPFARKGFLSRCIAKAIELLMNFGVLLVVYGILATSV